MTVEGTNVRFYRSEAGLKLRELSKRSGVSVAQLSELERGESNMTVPTLRRIAKGLGVSPADLISEIPDVKWTICSECKGRGMVKYRKPPS